MDLLLPRILHGLLHSNHNWGRSESRTGFFLVLWPDPFLFIVDLNEKRAAIPGDGNTGLISMTAADDIGGFVAAPCTRIPLSQWPIGEWGMCGNVYTPNQVVAIASKIRGSILSVEN
jgi:hypothetical protein